MASDEATSDATSSHAAAIDAEKPHRPSWRQFTLREIFVLALFVGLTAATWYQSLQIVRLNRDMERLQQRQYVSGEPLKYAGIASSPVYRRDTDGKPKYLECFGSKVEVYESFVLIHVIDRALPDTLVKYVEFIPRDQCCNYRFSRRDLECAASSSAVAFVRPAPFAAQIGDQCLWPTK